MDVRGTVTVSDPSALAELTTALERGDCTVDLIAPDALELSFEWGRPGTDGALEHAWSEVVFFLRAWQLRHPDVWLEVEDVRFAPSRDSVTASAA